MSTVRKGYRGLRVPGHALDVAILQFADCEDCRLAMEKMQSRTVGHGMCTCGAFGPHHKAWAGRKEWHREHRLEVLSEKAQKWAQIHGEAP